MHPLTLSSFLKRLRMNLFSKKIAKKFLSRALSALSQHSVSFALKSSKKHAFKKEVPDCSVGMVRELARRKGVKGRRVPSRSSAKACHEGEMITRRAPLPLRVPRRIRTEQRNKEL